MFLFLVLLHYAQSAINAAPTEPISMPGYTVSADAGAIGSTTEVCPAVSGGQRSVLSILWSCFATILACSWSSVHPNVAGPDMEWWHTIRHRLHLMLWAIFAPEIILIWAIGQWYGAQAIANQYKDRGWSIVHGHLLIMGGFMLYDHRTPLYVISPRKLEDLLGEYWSPRTQTGGKIPGQEPQIVFPPITEAGILDRSKGDAMSKALAIIQIGWFVIQCLARKAQGLATTELELVTVAFAVLNGIIYIFWWKKPLDVGSAIAVPLLKPSPRPTRSELALRLKEPDFFGVDSLIEPKYKKFEDRQKEKEGREKEKEADISDEKVTDLFEIIRFQPALPIMERKWDLDDDESETESKAEAQKASKAENSTNDLLSLNAPEADVINETGVHSQGVMPPVVSSSHSVAEVGDSPPEVIASDLRVSKTEIGETSVDKESSPSAIHAQSQDAQLEQDIADQRVLQDDVMSPPVIDNALPGTPQTLAPKQQKDEQSHSEVGPRCIPEASAGASDSPKSPMAQKHQHRDDGSRSGEGTSRSGSVEESTLKKSSNEHLDCIHLNAEGNGAPPSPGEAGGTCDNSEEKAASDELIKEVEIDYGARTPKAPNSDSLITEVPRFPSHDDDSDSDSNNDDDTVSENGEENMVSANDPYEQNRLPVYYVHNENEPAGSRYMTDGMIVRARLRKPKQEPPPKFRSMRLSEFEQFPSPPEPPPFSLKKTLEECAAALKWCILDMPSWPEFALDSAFGIVLELRYMAEDRDLEDGRTDVPPMRLFGVQERTQRVFSIVTAFVSMMFGAIYCVGWTFEFPTIFESVLWRLCSAVIVISPFLFFVRQMWRYLPVLHDRSFASSTKKAVRFFCLVWFPLFMVVRVVAILEAFIALRDLPPTAGAKVQWASFLPHV